MISATAAGDHAMKSAAVLLFALWMSSGFAQEASLKLTHTIPLNGVQGRLQLQELEQLLERARARLDANDCRLLQSLIHTVQQLWRLVEQQDMSMGRLRQLL